MILYITIYVNLDVCIGRLYACCHFFNLFNESGHNFVCQSGFTPLHIASHYGNIHVGRLLIEKGGDVNFKARVCIKIVKWSVKKYCFVKNLDIIHLMP